MALTIKEYDCTIAGGTCGKAKDSDTSVALSATNNGNNCGQSNANHGHGKPNKLQSKARGSQHQFTTHRVGEGGPLRLTVLFGGQKFNDIYMMDFTSETPKWLKMVLYEAELPLAALLTWQLSSGNIHKISRVWHGYGYSSGCLHTAV
jgi:hypothetical protein